MVANDDDIEEGPLFHHDRDNDFTGLQVPHNLNEGVPLPPSSGRIIRVTDMMDEDETLDHSVSDPDLGDSSAKE